MADMEAIALGADNENVGGLNHQEIWLIDAAKLDTIAAPDGLDTAADLASAATISTDHTPATGEGFRKIVAIPKTGNIESPMAGEEDARVFQNALTFAVKSNNPTVLGLARWAKDRNLIALVKEIGGQIRQLGSAEIPARLSEVTSTTGGGDYAGRKHVNFVLSDTQAYPAPVYSGSIPEPA